MMNIKILEKFEALNSEMLARVEGGGCNWGDFAKSGIAGGAGNGLKWIEIRNQDQNMARSSCRSCWGSYYWWSWLWSYLLVVSEMGE